MVCSTLYKVTATLLGNTNRESDGKLPSSINLYYTIQDLRYLLKDSNIKVTNIGIEREITALGGDYDKFIKGDLIIDLEVLFLGEQEVKDAVAESLAILGIKTFEIGIDRQDYP